MKRTKISSPTLLSIGRNIIVSHKVKNSSQQYTSVSISTVFNSAVITSVPKT
jgi:hypothetical protein